MKQFALSVCLVLLLLVVTVIPAAATTTITRISPTTAPNSGDVTLTITGTGFNAQSTVWLDTSPYGFDAPIQGTIVSWSPTSITSTFSMKGRTPYQYNVWVNSPFTDPFGNYNARDEGVLPAALKIYQDTASTGTTTTTTVTTNTTPVPANGSIFVSSFPSGANTYLDNEYRGVTPLTLKNVENGRHVVLVRLAGYRDWITNVVISGDSESLSAKLVFITPTTTAATVPTSTTPPTATVPRTFSPLGIELGIIATTGAALLLIKRK